MLPVKQAHASCEVVAERCGGSSPLASKLTQTGALPRVLVRAAVERYPDWWDTATVGPPYQKAELHPLCVLHDFIDQLRLARRQRSILQQRRKDERSAPTRKACSANSPPRSARNSQSSFDPALARLVVDDQQDEIDWSLFGLLAPFNGILVNEHAPTAVTSGGHTVAAAILNARGRGPRNTLS